MRIFSFCDAAICSPYLFHYFPSLISQPIWSRNLLEWSNRDSTPQNTLFLYLGSCCYLSLCAGESRGWAHSWTSPVQVSRSCASASHGSPSSGGGCDYGCLRRRWVFDLMVCTMPSFSQNSCNSIRKLWGDWGSLFRFSALWVWGMGCLGEWWLIGRGLRLEFFES
jgi:hypothetical protein